MPHPLHPLRPLHPSTRVAPSRRSWWISWAPFVGIFLAIISKGRTVRNIIIGGFVAPCLFCFLWFAVFGGVAIKMERIGELALGVKPDWKHGTVECDDHYDANGIAISAAATRLESGGYFMLACRPFVTMIYDVMMPYTNLKEFFQARLRAAAHLALCTLHHLHLSRLRLAARADTHRARWVHTDSRWLRLLHLVPL